MKITKQNRVNLIQDIASALPRISKEDIERLGNAYHLKTYDVIENHVAVVQEYRRRFPNEPIDMMVFKMIEEDLTHRARELLSTGLTSRQVQGITHLTFNKIIHFRDEQRLMLLYEHRNDPEAIESINYIFKRRTISEIRSLPFRLTAALFGLCFLKCHSKVNRPNEFEVANALYRAHRQYQELNLDHCDDAPCFQQASKFNPFTMADAYDVACDILTQESVGNRPKNSREAEHKMTGFSTILDTCPSCGNRYILFLTLGDKQSCPFCKVIHDLKFAAYPRINPTSKQKKDSK